MVPSQAPNPILCDPASPYPRSMMESPSSMKLLVNPEVPKEIGFVAFQDNSSMDPNESSVYIRKTTLYKEACIVINLNNIRVH